MPASSVSSYPSFADFMTSSQGAALKGALATGSIAHIPGQEGSSQVYAGESLGQAMDFSIGTVDVHVDFKAFLASPAGALLGQVNPEDVAVVSVHEGTHQLHVGPNLGQALAQTDRPVAPAPSSPRSPRGPRAR